MTDSSVQECPNCGGAALVEIAPHKQRCDYCGTVISSPAEPLTEVKCPRCGFENEWDSRYCKQCGLAINKWTSIEKPKMDLALVSILATVFGSMFLPIGAAILGVVLGYKARNLAQATEGRSGSEDLARIAIIVGWAGLAVSVLPLCAFPLLLSGQLGLTFCGGLFGV